MGAWYSDLFNKKAENDDQENLRRYQEKIDADGTFGFSDELDRREVKWWERLVFDKRFRILYVIVLALTIGILIPYIVFATKLKDDNRTIYGSCLIYNNARFQCMINSGKRETEEDCMKALCCWENNENLPFRCYHSFPTAYQYIVSSSEERVVNGTKWTTIQATGNQKDSGMMSDLKVLTHWQAKDHLVVEVFNSEKYSNRGATSDGESDDNTDFPFEVNWGNADKYFYIWIGRRDTGETIFDTRLGPVIATNNNITLSTVLPTRYFYGLKGGSGDGSSDDTLTYGVVNGFESAEFPFYMSLENSRKWHGVLIDTKAPMLTQVLQAPGILFHLETDEPEINLHFFAGPTEADINVQLHKHIQKTKGISHQPIIPPYWGLGVHLCRMEENSTLLYDGISKLLPDNAYNAKSIPFDSDCIEEYLRVSESEEDRESNLQNLTALLKANLKRIVLSARVMVPLPDEEKLNGGSNAILDNDAWLMHSNASLGPFNGSVDGFTVLYMDFFNPNLQGFPNLGEENLSYDGISVTDNFPIMYNPRKKCAEPKTRLQGLLSRPPSISVNSDRIWGSVCPDVVHVTDKKNKSHFSLHNAYGEESLKRAYATVIANQTEETGKEILITSSSTWTSSMYYGGFNGVKVPFTWRGLKDSVEHTVRNYAISPIPGTPICGSILFNVSLPHDNDLCLRWFQFGLLLPIVRNSYDGKSAFGPLDFSELYSGYLRESIKARYTYAPYYYTTLYQYQTTFTPMIRPTSFHFKNSSDLTSMISRFDQFMIGEALLATPIIERGVSRQAYFPAGTWYTMDGAIAYNRSTGSAQQVTGHITETPMFLREGYVIPTLQNQDQSISEAMQNNYTLLIALSKHINSTGSLTVKHNDELHSINFFAHLNSEKVLKVKVTSQCGGSGSANTIIDQIRVFGGPYQEALSVSLDPPHEDGHNEFNIRYFGEHYSLRISGLRMDWCKHKNSMYEISIMQKDQEGTTIQNDTTTSSSL